MKALRNITNLTAGFFAIISVFDFGIFLIASIFKNQIENLECAGMALVLSIICAIICHFTYDKSAHRKVIFTNKISCASCENSKNNPVEVIEIHFNDNSIDVSCPFDRTNCTRIIKGEQN